ncbi:hypothetical protein H0A70_07945 [Alcaligenaceae bacterium]|nr:hypothetical protein [Alcaligenaceae bacterium]
MEAEEELDALYDEDVDHAALIDELLWQLEENPGLLDELCREKHHALHTPTFQVKQFREVWKDGYNVFILKVWTGDGVSIPHRLIYGYHGQLDRYYVLTVMPRGVNYECDQNFIDKVCRIYDRIGIPAYRQ